MNMSMVDDSLGDVCSIGLMEIWSRCPAEMSGRRTPPTQHIGTKKAMMTTLLLGLDVLFLV